MKSKAQVYLEQAINDMKQRASVRDQASGERSMLNTVNAFNAMFGTSLTETQGWQFMELLKMARSRGGDFRADDFIDAAAYAALAGESADNVDRGGQDLTRIVTVDVALNKVISAGTHIHLEKGHKYIIDDRSGKGFLVCKYCGESDSDGKHLFSFTNVMGFSELVELCLDKITILYGIPHIEGYKKVILSNHRASNLKPGQSYKIQEYNTETGKYGGEFTASFVSINEFYANQTVWGIHSHTTHEVSFRNDRLLIVGMG